MSQPAGAIRALTAIVVVVVLALALAAGAEAGGKQGKSGKAKVALRTTLAVGSDRHGRGRCDRVVERSQGEEAEAVAGGDAGRRQDERRGEPPGLRSAAGGTAKTTFEINSKGEPLVRSCLDTEAPADRSGYSLGGEGREGRHEGSPSSVIPPSATGEDPVGVEVDTADRCDPISAPGEQCLFPYPNDFYTGPTTRPRPAAGST